MKNQIKNLLLTNEVDRDIDRIGLFLKKVEELWGKLPDWRFGQLMTNFISEKGDIFYWEEDKFLEELEDYINNKTHI